MQKSIFLVCLGLLILSSSLQARDDRLRFLIRDAMATSGAQEKLNGSVKFFFGDQAYPKPERQIYIYTSNPKTNAFGKSDKEACEWAWLSAMMALQKQAFLKTGSRLQG